MQARAGWARALADPTRSAAASTQIFPLTLPDLQRREILVVSVLDKKNKSVSNFQ